ncbi:hypothetical protein [Microbulbifer discodermiae]|uniref:hypothetical protein n=1 Tax=Microbulbifer sp. 2201CG32-9 TaxID=3232309 RepID=UPI00345BDD68
MRPLVNKKCTFLRRSADQTRKKMTGASFSDQFLPKSVDFGNRCGHTPELPDLSLRLPVNGGTVSDDKKRRGGIPGILLALLGRLDQYYWKPSIIPSLNLANGSRRQQRSERREGCLKILAAMVKFLDLTTLKVGIPQTSREFQGLTIPFLASHAGLSFSRASRAMKDLQTAGLVTVATRAEPDGEGGYRGVAAVKAIRKEVFAIFGLVRRLKYERERASKRQAKKQQDWKAEQNNQKGTLGDLARVKALIQGLLDPESKKHHSSPTGAAESIEIQKNRAKAARLRKLIEERPELTPDEVILLLKNEAE